jgi:hypothetical protein
MAKVPPPPFFSLPSPQIWKSNVEQYGQFIMGKNKMDAYQDNSQLKTEESNGSLMYPDQPQKTMHISRTYAATGKGKVANPTGGVALHQSVSWW